MRARRPPSPQTQGRHLTGAESAQLRLARLAPSSPAGVPLSRRTAAVREHGPLQLPAAHPSIPMPLVRPRRGV